MKKNITFIGAGNMAEALISGFLKSGLVSKSRITAADLKGARLSYLRKKYGIRTEKSNRNAVKNADIVFLAVKPQQMEDVLRDLALFVRKGQLVISLAAGITTKFIESYLQTAVIRSMPNTPALVGEGAIAVSKGRWASKKDLSTAKELFSTVGTVVALDEKHLNAVTALSGSGPAYVFYLAEAFEKAGEHLGLSKEVATALSKQTIFGAGKLLKQSDLNSSALRKMVTSPGGTTEAAIKHFEQQGFLNIVRGALSKAQNRAKQLNK